MLKNRELSCKSYYITQVLKVIRSSKNMLFFLKTKLIILFPNFVPWLICRVFGTLRIVIFFLMHPLYFIILSLNGTIDPYLVKWFMNVKRYLNSSDITCLFSAKHISQSLNYGSYDIFCLLHSHIFGLFLLFELDKY